MYRRPIINKSSTSTFKHLGTHNTHPEFFTSQTVYPRTISRHTKHQSSNFGNFTILRGFNTTRLNQAVYRRFGDDQNNKPTWSLTPSSNGKYRRWSKNQNFYGLPSWIWLVGAGGGVYYVTHLEKVELTGRWRFMDTSIEAEIATGEQVYMQTLAQFRSKLLPPTHPTSRFISGVAQKIIHASELPSHPDRSIDHFSNSSPELGDWASPGSPNSSNPGPVSDWKIHVIDEPKIQNAFVIPGGKIFVFTGILPICQNEAGLATVLGHEVAHQVLRHPAERMSSMKVIFLLTTMLSIVGLDPGICRAVVTLLMTLPNSRRSEVEADQIGLNIMASACYDPREAIGVWKRMDQHDRSSRITRKATEFLQTHPTHDRRIEKIISWLPEAQTHLDRNCGFTNKAFQQYNRWNP
ncbi:hypothetical protein PGT21_030787 [Puccinia graminis f. sp. tritici]|uniref:Peptidase M48 domain-containing protein n=1 Tax=Puccinia graminis f. sp. tritici TaxID=56615 RepID=A0A5B0MDG8_PUCGR|nr:hypothetical protein PGT21_030787 [Puccinia graminis f. sp. tritici]